MNEKYQKVVTDWVKVTKKVNRKLKANYDRGYIANVWSGIRTSAKVKQAIERVLNEN